MEGRVSGNGRHEYGVCVYLHIVTASCTEPRHGGGGEAVCGRQVCGEWWCAPVPLELGMNGAGRNVELQL